MVTSDLPSFVGFTPDDAEAAAAALGVTIVWVTAPPPKWLPPEREERVARQRQREDGTLELLRVLAPIVSEVNGDWRSRMRKQE